MKIRKIIHIDMDCFYASIEMRNNPSLQDRPIAVGGVAHKRGVLATCNYLARQYGLHSAMPSAQALKRCPDLVLIPPNMPLYRQVSVQIQAILRRYTPLIEPLSLDEAYLDVTDCPLYSSSATWIAQSIRTAIWEELQLTASAGVAPLKFLAKIASDKNKPNGQFVITPEQVDSFVRQLPLSKIPGVGKVSAKKLAQWGLLTCADVQRSNLNFLLAHLGKFGMRLWQFSHGEDYRTVEPTRKRKSIGVEVTLEQDITQIVEGKATIEQLYQKLMQRIQHSCPQLHEYHGHKVSVKLKFDDFQTTTLERSDLALTFSQVMVLLEHVWQRRQERKVRLIGMSVAIPNVQSSSQLSLW